MSIKDGGTGSMGKTHGPSFIPKEQQEHREDSDVEEQRTT
jgi:hypothetical protein